MSLDEKNDQALAHVCQVLDLDEEAATFLKQHRIRNVRKLIVTTVDEIRELTKIEGSPLHSTDIGQINIFREWYADFIRIKKEDF